MGDLSGFGITREKGVAAFFKTLGKRLILHVCALIASAVLAPGVGAFFCGYVGFVCLIPRHFNPKENFYLFPFASSLLQVVLFTIFLHENISMAIFWAGSQTWLQRCVIRRFDIGMDWSAAPFLLLSIAAFNAYQHAHPIVLVACALAGLLPFAVITTIQRKARLDGHMRAILSALDPGLKLQKFPAIFQAQFERLFTLGSRFYGISAVEKSKHYPLLASRLQELTPSVRQAGHWSTEAFQTQEANMLLALAADTNNLLEDVLERTAPASSQASTSQNALPGKNFGVFNDYYTNAEALLTKRSPLPEASQEHVTAIFLSTENMLQCMCNDPGDVTPGKKFLERYLPATHAVLDEYARLKGERATSPQVAEALEKSEKLLERLSMAFREEHGNLLRNDAIRFSADLNVVDTLLKMEGR